MFSRFRKRAFTLVELLIVIAIIGILTVAFLPALRGAPAKARDAARVALIKDISIALENAINSGKSIPDDFADQDKGGCLSDYGTDKKGKEIAAFLGRVPKTPQKIEGNTLCQMGEFNHVWYNRIGTTSSYMLAVSVENKENANVVDATTVDALDSTDTIPAYLALTAKAPTGNAPYFYMFAKGE